MAGVTDTGFVTKTVADLVDDGNAAVRAVYGAGVNVDARSRVGQWIGVTALLLSEAWEGIEAVASAFNPDSATGVLLENLGALTGTSKKAATYSTVTITAIGSSGTFIPAGKQVQVLGSSTVFATNGSATLTMAAAWLASTAVSKDQNINSGGSVWRAQNAGTTGIVAPSGAGPTFVDGGVTWYRLGTGLSLVDIPATATTTGPNQGYAGSVTIINTPVAGWTSVTNYLDAVPGSNVETDSEFRIRRRLEVAGIGATTLPGLRAELFGVDGVTSVTVFENATDATVDSVPPHAIEALVEGGLNQSIFDALLAGKPLGVNTYGNQSGGSTDSGGVSRALKFSRPVEVDIWARANLIVDPNAYPVDGDAQVKAALVAWGDARGLGIDVVSSAAMAAIFNSVAGVIDGTVLIGLSNPPVATTTLAMSLRQRGNFDTSRIAVSTSVGVP